VIIVVKEILICYNYVDKVGVCHMKKMSYFVVILMSFVMFLMHTFASSIVVINGTDVRFRSGATTSSSIIASLDNGVELTYIESVSKGNGCGDIWYKAQYGSSIGYVCSEFAILKEEEIITPEEYEEYSKYLEDAGFPDSYIPYLVELHKSHPNWQFRVLDTKVDFSKIVNLEYDGYSKGWSLIEDTGSYYDGYKSTDSWSYNYLTNVFSTNFTGGGSRWYAANKDTIAYYLDPRNFLNSKQIFMFESLSYNSDFHTISGVQAMLKGTFMSSGYADTENKKTYADAFIAAALKYDVSPYVLVSRVIQEVGSNGSTIVSGKVSGYEGYYNFYNIGAYGDSSKETIANGLKYARDKGWNNPYKAIVGGASFLSDGYISQGQDTLYLQKWDVIGPKYVNHQYMQNIQAPSTESVVTYNGYNKIGLVDSNFVFTIPVFDNMPAETKLPNKGNPNNYLSKLSVNGYYLFEKATTKTTFDMVVDSSTNSIDIAAAKVGSKSTISGLGSVSLNNDKESVLVTVTAENGDVRVYTINITKNTDATVALDISEILRVLNIKNDGSYIYGYKVGTDISTIINSITERESKAEVSVVDKNSKKKTSGIIASGDKIKIKTDREEKEYTLIIYGDVNGDGKISSSDYVSIKNHIMDIKKLSDIEKEFADANKDGKVSSSDYVTIKNHIMDVKKIVQ